MTEKKETDPLDKVARDSSRILAYTALVLSAILVIVVAIGTMLVVHAFNQLSADDAKSQRQTDIVVREEASLCDFFDVIATVPVTTSGPRKTTRIVVRWIIDSRNTYAARNCIPTLASPSPDLLQLAIEYKLKPPLE